VTVGQAAAAAAAVVHTNGADHNCTTTPHKQQHSSHADNSSSSSSSNSNSNAAVPDTGDILHVHFAAAPNTPAAAAAAAATAQSIADAATPLPLSSPPHSIPLEQVTRQKGAAPPRGGVMGTDVRTAAQLQQQKSQQQRSQQQQQQQQSQQQPHQQQLQQQGKRVSFSEEQEAFRPSYEVFTPGRAALGSVQYRAPEKRVPGAVAPASTVARPNYHDAIRRVSVVVFQHIQVSCSSCGSICSKDFAQV
jgi:hypothetical protein